MLARIRVWRDACFAVATQAHRVVVAALLLVACDEPIGSVNVNASVDTSVVLAATATEDNADADWRISLDPASAPAGEYLVFASTTAPTSAAALASSDATACPYPDAAKPACVVPGVGTLAGRKVLDTDGVLSTYDLSATGTGSHQYFVIVRRVTVAGTAATSLKATIILSHSARAPRC